VKDRRRSSRLCSKIDAGQIVLPLNIRYSSIVMSFESYLVRIKSVLGERTGKFIALVAVLVFGVLLGSVILGVDLSSSASGQPGAAGDPAVAPVPPKPTLDREAYDRKLLQLAHLSDLAGTAVTAAATDTAAETPEKIRLWPVKAAYPEYGAILPFKRIVAYYGNFLSKGMGVLGEYPEAVVIEKLTKELRAWEAADPTTPVQPGIDYIAVTAQQSAGKDGKYRLRMPPAQIDKALAIAAKIDGIVILEVQPGLADLMGEIKALEPYLRLPQVHLAIDPEFSMKTGAPPGTRVGTVDATDVNAAAEYLAGLVRTNGLPPKVLVVHRYTKEMVTNARKITPLPEVQIVMDMDGWGPQAKKFGTYNTCIAPEPVQFTGFKLFYKNDILRPGSRLLTPAEILTLTPQPSFIQFQ
jgi:hypothetical protein